MQIIAHRGASGYAPENTRVAFERAIAMGADAIETDVQLTADGALVLFHDTTVERNSNGRGPLADYTLAELRLLDLGGWYAPEFAGERVLTVAELLDEFVERIPLVLELKDPRAAAPLVAILSERRLLDRVQVTSFYWTALLDAQAANPGPSLGFLDADIRGGHCRAGGEARSRRFVPMLTGWTAKRVALAHERGLNVRAARYPAPIRWSGWRTPARTGRRVIGRIGCGDEDGGLNRCEGDHRTSSQ
ncbi:MAG: glycerophosphodiester phosphodiesterase family protein [Chloroflexia bacterium]